MKKNYFIPKIITINETQVPSTPFNFNQGKPLFLGDVFKVEYPEGGNETLMADLIDGQYVAVSLHTNDVTPLWIFEDFDVTVLGSSVEKPELLKLLTV